MIRKMLGAVCVLALSLGFVFAEDFGGTITKVDGNKITVMKKAKAKGEKGEEVVLEVAKDAKVVKGKASKGDDGKFKFEAGEAIEGGLKSEMFTKIGEKGIGARITTNDDGKVTTIMTMQGGGKKKKDV
jgi:hypothetical protein